MFCVTAGRLAVSPTASGGGYVLDFYCPRALASKWMARSMSAGIGRSEMLGAMRFWPGMALRFCDTAREVLRDLMPVRYIVLQLAIACLHVLRTVPLPK